MIMPVWKPRSWCPASASSTAAAQRADAQLHRVAVVDELGDVGGDAPLDVVPGARVGVFGQRPVGGDRRGERGRAESAGCRR